MNATHTWTDAYKATREGVYDNEDEAVVTWLKWFTPRDGAAGRPPRALADT